MLSEQETIEIRNNPDEVDWENISYYQELSEGFIREFSDKVNWENISYKQKLSNDFLVKNFDKLNIQFSLKNKNISEDTKNHIRMFV